MFAFNNLQVRNGNRGLQNLKRGGGGIQKKQGDASANSDVAATEKVEKTEGEEHENGLKHRDNLEKEIVHEGKREIQAVPLEGGPHKLASPRLFLEPLKEAKGLLARHECFRLL